MVTKNAMLSWLQRRVCCCCFFFGIPHLCCAVRTYVTYCMCVFFCLLRPCGVFVFSVVLLPSQLPACSCVCGSFDELTVLFVYVLISAHSTTVFEYKGTILTELTDYPADFLHHSDYIHIGLTFSKISLNYVELQLH